MPKYELYLTLSGTVNAPTLKSAMQQVDDAIDLSELKCRGINITGMHSNFNEIQESSSPEFPVGGKVI